MMTRVFSFAILIVLVRGVAPAQDLGIKAPPQSTPVMIFNATIHTVSDGVISPGYVVFEEGRITTVGREPAPSFGPGTTMEFIDGRGKHVYPGLIGANTVLGLMEIGAVRSTIDTNEVNSISPEVRAAVAVNPDSTLIPVTRSNGILTAGVLPLGGAIPGRASVIRLDGWTWEDMTILDDAGLVVNWPRLRPVNAWWMDDSEEEQLEQVKENLDAIDDAFDAAQAYLDARTSDPTIPVDLRWEAMRDVLEGRKPVLIRAQELEQIQSAVSWAVGRELRAVIVGGRDAGSVTDLLVRHDVGVIVAGTHQLPKRRDSAYDEIFRLPAELEKAGVRWCLATSGGSFQTPNERNLPYHAASAIAFGLSEDAALRAITLSAAELLGVAETHGSLERGKAATLFVSDGSPFEMTTSIEMAFIDGRRIDLENKQTKLNEKYREKYRQLDSGTGQSADEGEPSRGGAGSGTSR